MTPQQEAEARALNRLLKSDKRFFVPFTPAQGRRSMHAPRCIVEFHDATDLRYYTAANHFTDRAAFIGFDRRKYSELIKQATLVGRPLRRHYNTCIQDVASAESVEMQTTALEIARTKAALKFSDELYGKQKAETGLNSAQQFLAFKQAQREQQSE